MPYTAIATDLSPRLRLVQVQRDGKAVTYGQVLDLWQSDEVFRSTFVGWLLDPPFRAVRWETPPLSSATLERPFEFILHDAPLLVCRPSPRAFTEQLADAAPSGVTAFENLGRNALLVVPAPTSRTADYGHLAAFLRNAPESQRHALWQRVGSEMCRRISERPVWLSTAGMGVPWLHVRLDDRPKYYLYRPWAEEA